ncbi:MAG: hypothetical protein JWM68_4429 [Verrucomicrobiales bacterium]|nr:hypothetical protein [Verrucomicrobiales bacterium]
MNRDVPGNARSTIGVWLLIGGIVFVGTAIAVRRSSIVCCAAPSSCSYFLREIDGAKDQWAIEKGHKAAEPAVKSEIAQYIRGGIPLCPAGGVYSLNPVGRNPTCSIGGAGHSLP